MKNNKIWTIISVIVLLLQVAVEALTAIMVLRLNMLPGRFVIIMAVALVVSALVTGLLLFVRGKKGVGLARRIIACVLALLIVCGCALLSRIAGDAYNTMHSVTDDGQATVTRNMYVFVRTEDPANSLADVAGYHFAIVQDYDVEHTQQAIGEIEGKIESTIALTQYEKTSDLADALFAGQADALILNGAAVTLLMEEEAYADFTQKARILYTIPLIQETEPSGSNASVIDKEGSLTNTPFVVYISGIDSNSLKLKVSRSDVNILAVVNPVSKQVLLLNTPRDYYVPNPAGNGKLDKLTHCGLYGVDCSMKALEDLYDVKIQHHARINFTGFETLIDAVGGITIYSDQAFNAYETRIEKGENHLYGEDALRFARERYHVAGGDNGRGKNQMKVITALIDKMTDGTTIISNYTDIIKSLEGMFTTSITMEEISMLVRMQLSDMAKWNVKSFAVTGKGGSEKNYSSPGKNAYVMYPNEKLVSQASQLVDRVLAGETLTEENVKPLK